MVVLNEHCVVKAGAMVEPAAATDRVLLQAAKAGKGLSRVKDLGAGPVHGLDKSSGQCRHAGQVLENLKSRDGVKGEITLLIGKAEEAETPEPRVSVRQRVEQIMAGEKLDEKAALKRVSKERGISKSAAYREMQRTK